MKPFTCNGKTKAQPTIPAGRAAKWHAVHPILIVRRGFFVTVGDTAEQKYHYKCFKKNIFGRDRDFWHYLLGSKMLHKA